jgi:cytochrome c oxidase subunit 2
MHIHQYERYYMVAIGVTLGVFFASVLAAGLVFGIEPAQPGGFINPQLLGETEFANPGLRDMGDNHYDAYIVAQMWAFDTGSDEANDVGVDVLRIPQGSEVTFYIASRDITHGVLIEYHNLNLQLVPGHIASGTITFDRPGHFRAICHEYCGQAHHNMNFEIIVE